MIEDSCELTVYFDGQFWVGLFEKHQKGRLTVCRHVFWAEPKDAEVLYFIHKHFGQLKFSPSVDKSEHVAAKGNPKVQKRKIKAALENAGTIGTKSQQAVKLQTEQRKIERKAFNKEKRAEDANLKFELCQLKKKEKRLGH